MTKASSVLFSQLRQVGGMLGVQRWSRRAAAASGHAKSNHRTGLQVSTATKILTLVVLAAISISVYRNFDQLEETRQVLKASPLGGIMLLVGEIFIVFSTAVFLWKLWLVRRYKPYADVTDEQLPTVTIIVPAYNEGRQVLGTLRSLAASNYPPEKMQIIAIDDGSRDDTWQWICLAGRELRERVLTLRQIQNRGKRQALYEGFKRATGQILVTVDSDSIVDPETIRRMVCGFVHNPELGAVAGNVRVLNQHEGIFPLMLDVSFVYGFDFNRASQSMTGTVLCTPGALSAYRRDAIEKIMDEWLVQTFCGSPAGIGEDRAMTNLILRDGYYVHFQQNATVYTNVPTQYGQLCKMYIRWTRSDVRENLAMHEFVFKQFRRDQVWGTRINLLVQWIGCTVVPVFMLFTIGCLFWRPGVVMLNLLGGVAMWSTAPTLFYLLRHKNTDAFWAYAYGLFYTFALSWIIPYSVVTAHRSGWLTRNQPRATTIPAYTTSTATGTGTESASTAVRKVA